MQLQRDSTFFYIIFGMSSLKESFRKSKMNHEVLRLSADSRYLCSVALKNLEEKITWPYYQKFCAIKTYLNWLK